MNETYIKKGVSEQEYQLHSIATRLGHAPAIFSYNRKTRIMITELIQPMCISDMYGEDPKLVPKHIWKKIKHIVKDLYDVGGIEYVDITGYNFIEDVCGRVWIVDFGHCKHISAKSTRDQWVERFIADSNFCGWHPEFC